MTAPEIDTDALAAWMERHTELEGPTVTIDGRPSGGFSAETILATANSRAAAPRRFVIRLETPEPAVYPPQAAFTMPEIEIQYRIMDALTRGSSVPVAGLVGYEDSGAILGTPFFVMDFVDGVVPIESPPYSLEGFFTTLNATQRTQMLSNGLKELARLHSVELAPLGLEWLRPQSGEPGARHLMQLWKTFGETELRDRSHPLLETAWRLIGDELPEDSSIGLCWGDPRPGNIIWNGVTPACLTDFEAACLGPPEFDLGWWLMFDRTMHELAGVDRLPGDPTRDQQRSMYFEHAGRPEIDTAAHELFAAARYCVIVVRVMNRLEQRGLLPAESEVWRDNPASECLSLLLDERA